MAPRVMNPELLAKDSLEIILISSCFLGCLESVRVLVCALRK